MNKIYCYSFFIYYMRPVGHYLTHFINFGHHTQTFPAGGKSLCSLPESQAENWSSFTCPSALQPPAKSRLSWCMRSCWSGSWASSSCWSRSDRSSLLSTSRWAALERAAQGAAEVFLGMAVFPLRCWRWLLVHCQIDVHIFEPQGIRFLETDSTFMTNELTEALTKVQNETKVKQQLPDVAASDSFKVCFF